MLISIWPMPLKSRNLPPWLPPWSSRMLLLPNTWVYTFAFVSYHPYPCVPLYAVLYHDGRLLRLHHHRRRLHHPDELIVIFINFYFMFIIFIVINKAIIRNAIHSYRMLIKVEVICTNTVIMYD